MYSTTVQEEREKEAEEKRKPEDLLGFLLRWLDFYFIRRKKCTGKLIMFLIFSPEHRGLDLSRF